MNIKIEGGQVISGEVTPSGAKNSALAVVTASVLFNKPVVFNNVPNLTDIVTLLELLEKIGGKVEWDKEAHVLKIDNSEATYKVFNKDDLGNMKGMVLLWGAMLTRFGKTDFEQLPGGCALGVRPADTHFEAFRDLGVEVTETSTGVKMDGSQAEARTIWLREVSPTVTENVVMLATSLKGQTKIIGAASELSVQDLCNFLNSAGAKIDGIGSNVLVIDGGHELGSVTYKIPSDHYEIATYLALAACTGGSIRVHDALPEHFTPILREFAKFNIEIKYDGNDAIVEAGQQVKMNKSNGHTILLRPQPWPALPVDMLPLFVPLALKSPSGSALFHNWMYESGLFWTSELLKFGANVTIMDAHRVMVITGNKLKGATVVAPYIIRATVALIMVALLAEGKSTILNADSLDRGHGDLIDNLQKLGASIERVDGS